MTGRSAGGQERGPFDLAGRVALVTGSTKGIGRATARVLAQAGAHVVISSRKQEECEQVAAALRDEGLSADGRACHIGDLEAIRAMGDFLRERHGGLDVLVNNAVLSPARRIEDTEPALFDKAVEVDLRGYWYMAVEAAKLMRVRGGGSIVNVGSIAARHPSPTIGLYATLKSALSGMSRSFALEYGADGIRVNTVLPGLIQTGLASTYDREATDRIIGKTTLKRLGDPAEIGYAVLYLSAASGAYVTGISLVVDGGLSIGL